MELEKKLVYVGASRYDFKPDGETQSLKASKVFAINFEEVHRDNDRVGMLVSEMKAPYELFEKLMTLKPLNPYVFKLVISMNGKKTSIQIVDVIPAEK